ncbi:MAG TPA: S-methyl-5-thioribose-1-phosphate isomerase [Candidatus Acidoferrum sp.]|nr:S-methyl-5-thioribose-1-phosphate isomerase [Candidatus Acidoferrum sp.]
METIQEIANKIRNLEIQGARNVAIAAIESIENMSAQTHAKNRSKFIKEISKAKETLFAARETEPLMRNALRWITSQVKESKSSEVEKLVEIVSKSSRHFLEDLKVSKERIAEFGARRIKSDSVILTHCHSSTVTCLLEKAVHEGKTFEVICTETRPLFQGRKTAKEMLEHGIKTTLIIDSAARYLMNQVDLVIAGSDAITSEGNVINKIGTSMIALAAHESRTPFYIVSELLKFDPATAYGDYEKIEERGSAEIWKDAPAKLVIRNPAFDVTRRDYIHGVICEEGIVSPHSIMEIVRRKYPWIFDQSF